MRGSPLALTERGRAIRCYTCRTACMTFTAISRARSGSPTWRASAASRRSGTRSMAGTVLRTQRHWQHSSHPYDLPDRQPPAKRPRLSRWDGILGMAGSGGKRNGRFRDLAIGKPTLGAAWDASKFCMADGAAFWRSLDDAKSVSFASSEKLCIVGHARVGRCYGRQ